MLRNLGSIVYWWLRLGAKFGLVVPYATVGLVITSLLSQVFMLLAFLLPIKVVMLLGTGGGGRFMLPGLEGFDHENVVLALSGLSVLFYLLHLGGARLGARISEVGATRLLERTSKIVLFENQQEIARNAYKRYLDTLAKLLFSVLALVLIGYLYPAVAPLLLAILAVSCVGVLLLSKYMDVVSEYLAESFPQVVGVLSGLAFLSVFGFVVADFLWFSPPGFLVAIVTIILSRMLVGQLSGGLTGIFQLNKQHDRIDALFFHGAVFHPQQQREGRTVWELVAPPARDQWLSRCIGEVTGNDESNWEVSWIGVGVNDVLFLVVDVRRERKRFLIKLFDFNRGSGAQHEAALLLSNDFGLPAPDLLLATMVQGHHCHVMDLSGLSEISDGAWKSVKGTFRVALLRFEPEKTLVERYRRSKPMLWNRLGLNMIERLQIVAPAESKSVLTGAQSTFPEICERLRSLPVCVYNPAVWPSLIRLEGETPRHLHWGKWTLEPAGAGWPINGDGLEALADALETVRGEREALKNVDVKDCQLAALMFAFEKSYQQQNYHEAIVILERSAALLGS